MARIPDVEIERLKKEVAIERLVMGFMFALVAFCTALEAHIPRSLAYQPLTINLLVCGYDAASLVDTMGCTESRQKPTTTYRR